ncbi:unnamed protein product [Durusdinium trenchii]|uniref:Centrosomal protein of 70 kDa n=1 Tax=Durusdinium trenchii TaxID=1381693 RepID=A0ABP0I8L9_9DINO
MISEDDNESVGSSSSFPRQVSFGQKSNSSGASAQEGVPQRRSLVVEPADPVPTWCADAVVAEAIRELLSSNRPCAEWVDVFSEDSNGRIRKSALAAQSALLSQLDKEQENLQLEVQELERQVQERMLVASMKVPIDGQAEEKAKTAVQEMDRQIQALRTVQVPPSRDHAGQNDLHARLAGVQRCQEALKRGDHPDELPPVLRPVREALLLEKENQALMRQIVDLGPETEKFRANFATFKRSMERFNFRRRLSSQKRNELGDRNRNRALRQSCRELNVLREQVKRARAEAALD